ncbi:hypothetical protein [Loktanella agnita]|uniref:hypothetical protein n=1 Tax=Loktanella agnita TaxID=287097 RepID=UPI0039864517
MRRLAATLVAFSLSLFAAPVLAQQSENEKLDALFTALALPEMLQIMREEGLVYGDAMAEDLFGGQPPRRWSAVVSDIYDVDRMTETVRATFGAGLEGDDIDTMLDFFTSAPGQTVITLEVAARRALLDDATDAASKEAAAVAMVDETPRFQLVRDLVEANDLIESNVVGALNSNYAFFMGMLDGGAMQGGVTSETALQQVWGQEGQIRVSTTEWIYAFLLMAYQPLSDDDLEIYTAFSKTDAGQDLNDALFTSFNDMFDDLSRALGLASSRFMVSQEL